MAEIYDSESASANTPAAPSLPLLVVYWLLVGVPLLWGILQTLKKSLALFG